MHSCLRALEEAHSRAVAAYQLHSCGQPIARGMSRDYKSGSIFIAFVAPNEPLQGQFIQAFKTRGGCNAINLPSILESSQQNQGYATDPPGQRMKQ